MKKPHKSVILETMIEDSFVVPISVVIWPESEKLHGIVYIVVHNCVDRRTGAGSVMTSFRDGGIIGCATFSDSSTQRSKTKKLIDRATILYQRKSLNSRTQEAR